MILLLDIFNQLMENDDLLSWSKDYFLTWSDFKAEPNSSSFEDASCYLKYHPTWKVMFKTDNDEIFFLIENIQLSTQFLRHLSWVRKKQSSLNLLKHQQGHFDLAESFRSVIEKNLQNEFRDKKFPTRGANEEQQKQFARENSGLMIAKQLEKYDYELSQMRIKYDSETEYGLNPNKQLEYDDKFSKLRK